MITRGVFALCAVALVSGCKAQQDANQANSAIPSAEARNGASVAAPLTKEQALAVMKQRHDRMKALGGATKAAHNALQSSSPDMAAIRDSAAKMDALAPKLVSWFPEGTGPDVGKTRAKAEIWKKPEDFALKGHDFTVAARQFAVASKSGDMTQINGTFAALGKTCKACHDLYRAPEKH